MKESGEMHLKSTIYESTLSTADAVPLPRKGLAWTLPPSYGRRCPEGAEVGWG